MNGYYSFGDVNNNYQKEDEESEEYKAKFNELTELKKTLFANLVVCKWKDAQYESIVNITDQLLEFDPDNKKGLFFRGKALLQLQEYDKATEPLNHLVKIDPSNKDALMELDKAKKIKRA